MILHPRLFLWYPGAPRHLHLNFAWASLLDLSNTELLAAPSHTSSPDFHISGNHMAPRPLLISDCSFPSLLPAPGSVIPAGFLCSDIDRLPLPPVPCPPAPTFPLPYWQKLLALGRLLLLPSMVSWQQTTFWKYKSVLICLFKTFQRFLNVLRI